MIKSISRLMAVLVFIQGTALFAADWESFFATSEFSVVSTNEDSTEYALNIPIVGNSVPVELRVDDPSYAPYLLQLTTIEEFLLAFESIVPQKIELVMQNRHSVIYIIPSVLPTRGGNGVSYLPSGIRLYYEEKLEYDFYMLINALMLNIKGQYFNETHLLSRINDALQDPLTFVASQEPSFLLKRIDALEDRLNQLNEETVQTLTSVAQQARNDIDANNTNIEQLQTDVTQLQTDAIQLQTDVTQLSADMDTFRKGSIRLNTKSNISDAIIDAVIKAYNGLSEASSAEIRKILQEQGHKVKTKEIRAVVANYFGQYIK